MKFILVVISLALSFRAYSQKVDKEISIPLIYQSVYNAFEEHVYNDLNPRVKNGLCFSGIIGFADTYIADDFQQRFVELNDFDPSVVKSVNSGFDYKIQKRRIPNRRLKCNHELKIYKAIEYNGLIYVLLKIKGELENDWYLFQYKSDAEIPITYAHSSLTY